jgi:hypothetical protein
VGVEWLRALEPWAPWISRTLLFAWCLWITVWIWGHGKRVKRIEATVTESKEVGLRHRTMFLRFLDQNGWGDNFTKTQVIDPKDLKR